jgi:lysophospholipase L1-like esterase
MTGKTVVNAGSGGARSASGVGRVNGLLQQYKPSRLLVLYGANDIGAGVSVEEFEGNLRAIVGAAKANRTIPVLGTIPPEYDSHAFAMPAIQTFNARIGSIGSSEGVPVANVYGAFGGNRSYIQEDGLHPTDAGNEALARAFANRVP